MKTKLEHILVPISILMAGFFTCVEPKILNKQPIYKKYQILQKIEEAAKYSLNPNNLKYPLSTIQNCSLFLQKKIEQYTTKIGNKNN